VLLRRAGAPGHCGGPRGRPRPAHRVPEIRRRPRCRRRWWLIRPSC